MTVGKDGSKSIKRHRTNKLAGGTLVAVADGVGGLAVVAGLALSLGQLAISIHFTAQSAAWQKATGGVHCALIDRCARGLNHDSSASLRSSHFGRVTSAASLRPTAAVAAT